MIVFFLPFFSFFRPSVPCVAYLKNFQGREAATDTGGAGQLGHTRTYPWCASKKKVFYVRTKGIVSDQMTQ